LRGALGVDHVLTK